ncbi:MAG: gamma-glutamylcyclotransferase, partial [Nitrospirae bacterium]
EDAVIEGYRRVKIRDAIYPALIRAPSFSVRGKLLWGLSQEELNLVDSFEGEEYERTKVIVKTSSGKEPAFVYIYKEQYLELLIDKDWDPSEISTLDLKAFLRSES